VRDRSDAVLSELNLFSGQPIRLELLDQQMPPRNLELLTLGITRQADDLESVLQRRRDRVQHIGRSYEHHV